MKRITTLYLSVAAILLMAATACTPSTPKRAKLLVGGSSWDSIAIVDKETGEVEWRYGLPREYGGPECNSAEVLPDGKVLISFKRGARLIERDRTGAGNDIVVWDYTDLADTAELQTAKQLKDGGFLLGICDGPARFVELDKDGKVRKEVTYDLAIAKPHGQFRRMLKSENEGPDQGNYIIPVMGRGKIVEIDGDGELVREFRVPGGPFDACELQDGNLLVSLGNRHAMVVVDRESGDVLEQIGRENLDTLQVGQLHFVTQITARDNGNVVISNWQGYLPQEMLGINPQLIEVDADRNIVWTYDGRKKGVKYISTFYEFEE